MSHCTTDKCPQILDSSCVFYEGSTLIYSGINTNDSVETVIQKLNLKLESIPVFNSNNYYNKTEVNNIIKGYIPLSGTLPNYPVTGNIEFSPGNNSKLYSNDSSIVLDDGSVDINGNYITISSINNNNSVLINNDQVFLNSGNSNNRKFINLSQELNYISLQSNTDGAGLVGQNYYGNNYVDNSFVQKKFVIDTFNNIDLSNFYTKNETYSKIEINELLDVIEVTKTELDNLISSSQLVKGSLYKISGVNPTLYGGTTIFLTAIENNKLSIDGYGVFYNPKYDKSIDGFGIVKDYVFWKSIEEQTESGVYNIGDRVIWGGKHWNCISPTLINTKYIIDKFNLDTVYFEEIPFNETDYNIVYDEIKYDYEHDLIIERNEQNSNIVSFSYDSLNKLSNDTLEANLTKDNPIKNFQWGNIFDYNLSKGIGNNKIKDSINENINFSGGFQINLTFTNNSYQINLTFTDSSHQVGLTFNNSYQYNLNFTNSSYQYNLNFTNSSYQGVLTFNNSSQYNLIFNNSSYQYNLNFTNNSYQNNLNFTNNSYQYNLNFTNNSYQNNLNFNNSIQSNLTITNNIYQNFLTFKNFSYDRENLTLSQNEVGLTFDNTKQSIKLTGNEFFTGKTTNDFAQIGDLNTKADLVNGKVPSSQLPSYVDDVLEFANLASFPATGESGKIYIALDTNITYRWSGTGYAEISASLALGETSNTAYRGDRGKIAYDHSQVTHDKNLVGLGNVDNTSDLNKPISNATQIALNLKLSTEAPSTTGTVISFSTDKVYGTLTTPETGNITADVTNAKLGVTNIIIHNSGTAPTFGSQFKKLSGSGNYVTGVVNYIYCTYISTTEIIYSINQRA